MKNSKVLRFIVLRRQTLGWRVILASLGWWVISEGNPEAVWIGIPAVSGAVAMSMMLAPQQEYRVHIPGLLLFAGYFLTRSLVAGLDMARRILAPSLPVDPIMIQIPITLNRGAPYWLLANTMSLLPGTLSVTPLSDAIVLHCLDSADDVAAEVHAMEKQVAKVFGLEQDPSL